MSPIQKQIFHYQRSCLLLTSLQDCGPIITRFRGLPQAPSRLHRSLYLLCTFLPYPSCPEAGVRWYSLDFLFFFFSSLIGPSLLSSLLELSSALRSSSYVSLFLPTQAFLESQGLGRQTSSLQTHLHQQNPPFTNL